jgi:hypothetical protein
MKEPVMTKSGITYEREAIVRVLGMPMGKRMSLGRVKEGQG